MLGLRRNRLLVALAATSLAAACSSDPAVDDRPNVVLVTIDTLRPDHLGAYGYERATSPNLDRFAAECVRFTEAHSTSSFTPPSHASILTSRYPGDHGLVTWNPLEASAVSLAEVLRDAGYRTGASTNLTLLSRQNLGQGFGWGREARSTERRMAPEIVRDGLEFLAVDSAAPFFLWLHFYDVHRPYGGSQTHKLRFHDGAPSNVGDVQAHYNLTGDEVRDRRLSQEDLQLIRDRYDGGIAFVDEQLAPLFEKLSAPPYRDDTLVVVTSDHGEVLLERYPAFSHDPFLFGAVTRIPMLIRRPGAPDAGKVSDGLVSLIDVAPTVLDVVGLERPASFDGASLLPLVERGDWSRDELFMENWGWVRTKAIRTAESLVIHDLRDGVSRYYDLAADPTEFDPSVEPRNPRERELGAKLLEFVRREGIPTENPELGGSTVENLRELGYAE